MTFEDYKQQYNICLNAQQEKAVQTVNGNVLLLAVPGSGKTTVLVARLGYMIYACNIPPENILTMTYTVAAANDMKKRFISKFGDDYADRLVFKTINAVCLNIIRYYSKTKGTAPFEMIDESDRASLLSRLFKEVNNDYPTELQKKSMSSDITYLKNMMLTKEEIQEYKSEGYRNLPVIFERYNNELRRMKKMDFDDQLVYTFTILTKYPDILEHFTNFYRYICVDEAQDTSKIQHEIIRLLATGSGGAGNYFAVGDEDQSIYGFRAAYPEALYNFEKVYPNSQVLLMEKNYRSTGAIVSSADMFIQKNLNRHPKSMVADSDDEGEEIEFINFKNRSDQYEPLVNIAKYSEIQTAILFRDNDASIPIIDKLERENIGYRARGLDSVFFSNPVVIDIVGIIQFALGNCTDQQFFLKNYYKLGMYLKKNQAEMILKSCPVGKNIIDYIASKKCKALSPTQVGNAAQTKVFYNIIKNSQGGAETALNAVVYGLEYKSYLENFNKSATALPILSEIAREEPSAERLISRLSELKEIIAKGGSDNKSKFILSTVHSSKGLEYDRVVIIDAFDGSFPKAAKDDQRDEYEEERRLFYVAMTRTRKKLIIYKYSTENCSFQKELQSDIRKKEKENGSKHEGMPATVRPSPASCATEDKLYPGTFLFHKMFGKGTVTDRLENGTVTISFEKGTTKNLVTEILLRNRLVKYLDEKETERKE